MINTRYNAFNSCTRLSRLLLSNIINISNYNFTIYNNLVEIYYLLLIIINLLIVVSIDNESLNGYKIYLK